MWSLLLWVTFGLLASSRSDHHTQDPTPSVEAQYNSHAPADYVPELTEPVEEHHIPAFTEADHHAEPEATASAHEAVTDAPEPVDHGTDVPVVHATDAPVVLHGDHEVETTAAAAHGEVEEMHPLATESTYTGLTQDRHALDEGNVTSAVGPTDHPVTTMDIEGSADLAHHTEETATTAQPSDAPQHATEAKEPVTDLKEPATEVIDPVTELKEPTTEVIDPVTEVKDPVTEVKDPVTEVKEPTTEVKDPATEVKEPTTEVKDPVTEAEEPATEAKEPTTEVKDPTTEAKEPATEAKEPATEAPAQDAVQLGVADSTQAPEKPKGRMSPVGEPEPEPETSKTSNWWIVGVIMAVLAVLLAVFYVAKRRSWCGLQQTLRITTKDGSEGNGAAASSVASTRAEEREQEMVTLMNKEKIQENGNNTEEFTVITLEESPDKELA